MPEKASVRLADVGGVVDPLVGGVGQAVDGRTVASLDEVLLPSPPNGDAYSGPWVAAAGPWSRRADWDAVSEMAPGDWWYVRDGARLAGTTWQFENPAAPTTLNVDTLTVGRRTHRRAPEGSGGITLNDNTAPPFFELAATEDLNSTFVEGLRLEWLSANSLRVKAGAAYVPQSGAALDMAQDADLTGLVLAANTWYHAYVAVSGNSLVLDPLSTQAPHTVPYRGGARVKGPDSGPDESRRYVGSVRTTNVANTLYNFRHRGDWIYYVADAATGTAAGGLRIASALAGSVYAARDASPLVPPVSDIAEVYVSATGAAAELNLDPTGATNQNLTAARAGEGNALVARLNASQQFFTRNSVGGGSTDVAILSYLLER